MKRFFWYLKTWLTMWSPPYFRFFFHYRKQHFSLVLNQIHFLCFFSYSTPYSPFLCPFPVTSTLVWQHRSYLLTTNTLLSKHINTKNIEKELKCLWHCTIVPKLGKELQNENKCYLNIIIQPFTGLWILHGFSTLAILIFEIFKNLKKVLLSISI